MPKPLLPGQWLRVVGLTVTLLLALLPARAQDIGETFTYGDLNYRVITESTVEVAGPANGTTPIDITIPATAENEGQNYDVTAIGTYAFFDNATLKSVSLPIGIVRIEGAAFCACRNLTTIIIPETVRSIGAEAFENCDNLASIILPNNIEEIGEIAFMGTPMASVNVPASLKKLGSQAFQNISSIVFLGESAPEVTGWGSTLYFSNNEVKIYVPNESLEAYGAIAGDYTVQAILIPDNGATKVAFNESEITLISGSDETKNITLSIEPTDYDGEIEWNISPEWLADITVADDKMSATLTPNRWNCGVATVTATVTSTDGSKLTASCKINVFGIKIKSPYDLIFTPGANYKVECEILPSSMTEGVTLQWATDNHNVATVDQDGNITGVADGLCNLTVYALKNGSIVTSSESSIIIVSELQSEPESLLMKPGEEKELKIIIGPVSSSRKWESDDENIAKYEYNVKALNVGKTTLNISFPMLDGTTLPLSCEVTVNNYISCGEEFTINGIVYRILTESTVEVAGVAEGTTITEVTIPETVEYSFENRTYLFDVVAVGKSAFSMRDIISVTLPNSIKTIKESAFYSCTSLSSIEMPGVESINQSAFAYCHIIESLNLPESIKALGVRAIEGCFNLRSIIIRSTNPPTMTYGTALSNLSEDVIIYVPAESVDAYKAWTTYTVMPIGSVVSDEFEYEGLMYRINKDSETPSVELIGVAEGNTNSQANIPATAINGTDEYPVVGIAANAFADNQDIKSVEIPASVTSIGDGAFAGCDSLSVTMPGNNVTMGEGVFEGCSDLAVKVTPTEGGEGSENTTTLGTGFAGTPITEVTISDEITQIAPGAFENCDQLTSIVIPDQVETIGASTFENCTSLQGVKLGSNVTTIAPDAFAGADAITEVVCLSTNPPAFEEVAVVSRAAEGFKGFEQTVYDNATLIVPAGTEAAYKEAPIWKEFTNIQEVADVKVTVTVPEQVILFEGENFRLTPVFTPAVPEGYTVSYSSDRSYVATVGENGYISAVDAGVAGITVSVKDKNGNVVASATTNVAVGNDVSQLYDNVTIPVYRAMMVPLVLEPLDYLIGFMTCEAENPDIVTAYNNGSIYGNRVGETNLKMTFGLSEYSCKVKVVSEIRDIEIHTGNGTDIVPLGSPLKLFATTPDGDRVPVTWEMYSSSVASVNYYTGEVTTAESGSCTIIARAVFDPELVAYYVLNVTDNPATGVTLDKSVLEMTEGETEQLTATATPANADAVIVWTSSDEAIATVGASTGEVTAVSAGTVTITATDAVTGISASCTVTVSKPSGIEGVDTAAISVRAESGRIIVKGAPADAAVEIFDIAGSRIALERGDCSVSVNAGIYVVRVAGTTIKVAVK